MDTVVHKRVGATKPPPHDQVYSLTMKEERTGANLCARLENITIFDVTGDIDLANSPASGKPCSPSFERRKFPASS